MSSSVRNYGAILLSLSASCIGACKDYCSKEKLVDESYYSVDMYGVHTYSTGIFLVLEAAIERFHGHDAPLSPRGPLHAQFLAYNTVPL